MRFLGFLNNAQSREKLLTLRLHSSTKSYCAKCEKFFWRYIRFLIKSTSFKTGGANRVPRAGKSTGGKMPGLVFEKTEHGHVIHKMSYTAGRKTEKFEQVAKARADDNKKKTINAKTYV